MGMKSRARAGMLVVAALTVLPLSSSAQGALRIPEPTGLVSDFAGVLDPASVQRMTRIADHVRTRSRGEIAIVTLPDIGDIPAAEAALRIGRQWKVGRIGDPGDPTRNAGAVILLVPKETSSDGRGRCFIATGTGAEGFITDATAGDICREAIPAFARRDYSTGLELVTLRTAQRFATEFGFQLDTALVPPEPAPSGEDTLPLAQIIALLLIFLVLSSAFGRRRGCGCMGCLPLLLPVPTGRRRRGRRSGGSHWGGGGGWSGGGGGFGGFGGFGGGGGFAGGGGGSSW